MVFQKRNKKASSTTNQNTRMIDQGNESSTTLNIQQQQQDQILSYSCSFTPQEETYTYFITDVKVDPKRKLLLASTYSSGRINVHDLESKKLLYSIKVGGDSSGCCYYLNIEEPFENENDLMGHHQSSQNNTNNNGSVEQRSLNGQVIPCNLTLNQETIQMACTYPSVIVTTDMYSFYTVEKYIMCPTLYEPHSKTHRSNYIDKSRLWKSSASEFHALRGLCIDHASRKVYVSDRDANRIRVLSSRDGQLLNSFQFNSPTDITFYEGNLLVCEKSTHSVHVVSPIDGTIVRSIANGSFSYPRGVIVDPNTRHIIVSDSDHHKLKIFNWTGEMLEEFQQAPGSHSNLLNTPFGVSLDYHSGLLYVADCYNYKIQIFKYNARWYKNEKRFKELMTSPKQEQFSDVTILVFELIQ
ncbi:hypothetical protein C9374_004562 [Naegleria lovaniensis]|uniref:NHL repeat-containing protein n=1 Tax=Naegleria lovaniensis TaxID=51637 RepID=A0AA88KL40_NAELO|nr:uncharacterized protein C9374_004562 [Naegleria lovaniensis]KAG2383225.1 hypothetical protein C9374_004562 [Naegleria lovaniensis]